MVIYSSEAVDRKAKHVCTCSIGMSMGIRLPFAYNMDMRLLLKLSMGRTTTGIKYGFETTTGMKYRYETITDCYCSFS